MCVFLLLLFCSAFVGGQGLDVVKTRQPWQGAAGPIDEAAFQALVVRQGDVASAFSLETGMTDALLPSFLRIPPIGASSFLFPNGLFGLYAESAPESRFIVASRTASVAVTGYGVVDGTGAFTRQGESSRCGMMIVLMCSHTCRPHMHVQIMH